MRAALISLAALLAMPAQAAEANRCVVSVTPVQFGVYNPLVPGDMRTTGIVTYNCTQSRPISISLTRGSASFYDRGMGQGLNTLSYNLYLDAAGTMIWGDGSGGSQAYRAIQRLRPTPMSRCRSTAACRRASARCIWAWWTTRCQ